MEGMSPQREKVYEYELKPNPIHLETPSKTRLKKCEIGLHEFVSEGIVYLDRYSFKEDWSCRHCKRPMDSR